MEESSGKIPSVQFEFTVDPAGQPAETELLALFEVPDAILQDGAVEEITESEYEESLCRCIYCRKILDPSDNDTYSEVLTWLRGRNKDSSTLRTYTGRLSCSSHIHNLRSGISPTQTGIVELADEAPMAVPGIEEAFTDQTADWQRGYRDGLDGNFDLPDSVDPASDYMIGLGAGIDRREEDRWK